MNKKYYMLYKKKWLLAKLQTMCMMDLAKILSVRIYGNEDMARSIAGSIRFVINGDNYTDLDRASIVKKRTFHKKKKSL